MVRWKLCATALPTSNSGSQKGMIVATTSFPDIIMSMRLPGRERKQNEYVEWFCEWAAGRSSPTVNVLVIGMPPAPEHWTDNELGLLSGLLEFVIKQQEYENAKASDPQDGLVFTRAASPSERGNKEGAGGYRAGVRRDDPHRRTQRNNEDRGIDPPQVPLEARLTGM